MAFQAVITLVFSLVSLIWHYPPRLTWMHGREGIQAPVVPLLASPPFSPTVGTTSTKPIMDLVVWSGGHNPPHSAKPFVLLFFGLLALVAFLRLRLALNTIINNNVVLAPIRKVSTSSHATQTTAPASAVLDFSTTMHTNYRATAPSFLTTEEVNAQLANNMARVLDLEIDLGTAKTALNEALSKCRRLEKQLAAANIRYNDDTTDDEDEAVELARIRTVRQRTHCSDCHRRFASSLPGLCRACISTKNLHDTRERFGAVAEDIAARRGRALRLRRERIFGGETMSVPGGFE